MKKLILLLPIFFLNVITLWAQFPPPPSGPIADFVEINGTLEVGETLTGSYDYFDPNDIPEDGSTYQWYRADDEFGVGWTAISGAVDTTYILAAADDGKYISFEVTPSNGAETGMPAESMLEGPVGAGSGGGNIPPVASNVSFTGTLEVGATLTGSYNYSDADNDPEVGSLYIWYRNDGLNKTPIAGADSQTYTLVTADEGKNISFAVIPSDGIDAGSEEESSSQGPILAEPTPPTISFAGGTGSEGDPYQVATLEQLQALKDSPSFHYVLNNDLDASATSTWNSGEGFVPIGGNTPFTGSLDGQGFVITGLAIDRTTEDYVGLFAVIGDGGTVSNIGLEQLSISGGGNTGGLAGENNGSISGSYADGDVDGSAIVGGLVGLNNSTISKSYSAGTVDGTQDIGGLIGLHSLGTVSESYSSSNVTGSANNVGGLIGFSYDNVENSFATGSVSGDTNVGGLVGNYNSGTVSNSFSSGSVSGSTNVGGFIGQKNSFAAANNSFWDTQASGQASATGIGSTTGITGKTTAEMKTQSTYTDAGWDFTSTWAIDAGVNGGYPVQQDNLEEIVNSAPTGSVTISGTPQEDQILTASHNLADADGLGAITYQWQRDGVNIAGATNSTYTLVQDDVGAVITVVASYTDGQGTVESVISAGTSAIVNVNDAPTGSVSISGTTQEDETLTASDNLSDEDGLGTITYQWQRDGVNIVGATNSTYTLVQNDVGTVITVVASYTDGQGTVESVISAGTSAIANVNDVPTGSVSISGTTQEDETLTASDNLSDEDGLGAIIYQWQRDGVNIVGATNSTYTLVQNDVGAVITVVASYTDGEGTSESVTSEGTDVVISSNTSPEVTNAIADFTVGENAPDSLIDLTSVFFDAEDNDGDLTYSVVSNSNPTLVSVTPNQSTDLLTLNFQADQIGTADITIRATDSGGLTADDSFTITVEEVLIVDPATAFITTWNTSAPGQTVTIPTKGDGVSDYDFTIDWGDGTVETYSGNEPVVSHTYTSAGDYEVLIGGTFPYFAGDETDLSGLTSIDQWGNINWEYMENMFYQATNLATYSATDTPDLSGVSTLKGMFAFTGLSTADLSGWDVSTVTNFFAMFSGAASFNGDLSDWVFSTDPYSEANGLNFNGMFNLASSFTGTGLETWDVSNADSLATMFADASAFDADLSGWDVSNVKDMFLMAEGAGLSTINYTAMLSSWSALSVQDNVDLGVGETTYTSAGVEGRETLINTYNWTITDGGLTAGALSLSTAETSPIDTSVTDTLWMDLTMDGTVVTETLTPGWTLTPAAGMTATGTPVYNETRQQWGYDLSGIEVNVLDQAYSLNVSASVSLENGTSSVDDNFSINITVPNTAPVVVAAIDDVTVDEDAADTSIDDLTSYFADTEESAGDLVYSIETNSNPTLLTASVNNTTDDLTLSYEANEFGTADITVRATDSGGLTADTSFTVTVNAVNDVPFFTKGSDQTVDENSGAQAVNGWASAISAGAANESVQALNFNISTNNDDLFSVLPVIDTSTGDLSYTPAADSFGVATVTINLSDDGGTVNGGSDTSADQTFIITVEEVLTVDPLTAFITTWNTSTPGETVTIPTGGGATISDYNAIIDWGDGTIERFIGDDPDPSHTYATAGDYTVSIGGTFPHLSPAADGEMDQLISVDQWGTNQWESMNRAFAWAKNMEYNATDTPDFSGVTDMGAMFFAAAKFNGEIGNWDVSTITAMGFAFDGASIFNGDISGWTVTNVTGMRDMFQNAAAFNQDLSSWDIRNVTNMLNFMDGTALSTANYNNMLSTWSTLPLTSSVNFSVGTTPYSIAGKTDRDSITDTFGWTITDGGLTANALSVSTMETSPVDLGTFDTLWIDLTIDDSVATDALNPTWTLTPESGLTVTGTPVYNETREQWALDLSNITVVEYDREYTFDMSASVPLENGTSSIEDNFSINITVPNTAPFVDNTIGDFSIDEDATLDAVDLTIIFSDAEDNDADLNYSVTNSNPSILNATIDTENNLVLTLVADSSGTADVTIQAEDSEGLTVQGSFTLTINPVNDAPIVANPIADITINEDGTIDPIDLTNVFTDIDNALSDLTYLENSSALEMISASIDEETNLVSFTVTPDANGTAEFIVAAQDTDQAFAFDTVSITVNPVNDAPSFVTGADQNVNLEDGSQIVSGWATAMSAGAENESSQMLTFNVSTDNDALFSVLPAIDPTTGDLTFTPTAVGEATVTVTLSDDGGTNNGGVDTSAPQTFTITTSRLPMVLNAVEPFGAKPGTPITLQGAGFDPSAGDNTVLFTKIGETIGTNATVSSITGTTQLKVTVPETLTSGQYKISISRAGDNTSATLAPLFTAVTGGGSIAGTQNVITSNVEGAQSVYATDLDGDGDLDVLSASSSDDKIAWYENNGDGTFSGQQVITTDANNTLSVYAADLDGDGDLDVLSASSSDDKIAWYENNGDGTFGGQQVITTAATSAASVYAADLDGDGDLDVLSASVGDDKIAWYKNNGDGTFGAQQVITTNSIDPWTVHAADLDGDGDLDVLSASITDNKIAWYENNGDGTFGDQQVITTYANRALSVFVYATDLDGDGDLDVLSASSSDDKIAWSENNGDGTFGAQQVITTAADGATSVYAADLDGDGDMDVLSASGLDDKVAWYENNGDGTFGGQQVITTNAGNATSVYAADLDGDGDMDVLSAYNGENNIAWYENRSPNQPPIVTAPIADINVQEDGTIEGIDLTTIFSDEYDDATDLIYTVTSNTNAGLVSTNISNETDSLLINLTADSYGTAEITIQAEDSDGATITDSFSITVNPVALQLTLLSDRTDTLTIYPGFTDTLRFTAQDANANPIISDDDLTWTVTNDYGLTIADPVYDATNENWYITFKSEDNESALGTLSIEVQYTEYENLGQTKSVVLDPSGNRPFITTWDVSGDNMSVTFPTADQVDGKDLSNFDFRIDWGNGESEWISGAEPTVTKTYTAEGTKTVKISGNFPYLSGTKVLFGTNEITGNMESITQWGDIEWESMKNSFTSITNLTLSASDVPDLSQVTSLEGMFSISGITTPDISGWDVSGITNMEQMFLFAVNFNSDISGWNVGNVQNMNGMFTYSQSFNGDIGNWNVASVDSMLGMFANAAAFDQNLADWDISQVVSFDDESQGAGFMNGTALSTANYDSLLAGWGAQTVQPDLTISFGEAQYSLDGQAGRQQLLNAGWTINDGGLGGNPFITTWRTTTANESITIPTGGGIDIVDYDFLISWGDGTVDMVTGDDPDPTHTYTEPGDYEVVIVASNFYLRPNQDGDLNQLISLDQWGGIEWQSMNNSFAWARNMEYNAIDVPDLSKVESMAGMFFAAEKLSGDFSGWNTSTVTDMSFMFDGAKIFNGDISTWDVSKVTNMREMFQNADSLNQDLSSWNVSAVTNMQGLFQNAVSFNGDVSTWNTGAATNMFGLFAGASSFNQDVSGWDVSNVHDMGGMFLNASAFDQDLSEWDISSVARLDNGEFGFLQGSSISQQNYDLLLNKWSQLSDVNTGLSLSVGDTKYGVSGAERQALIDGKNWTIKDGGAFLPFTTTWEITSDNPSITIGTIGGEELSDFDFTLNWGDGTVERFTGDKPVIAHTYEDFATQTVQIAGTFPEMNSSVDGAVVSSLRTVEQWGDISWETMSGMFAGISNLVFNAEGTPELSEVESMEAMFASLSGSNFNSDISDWDVSNVTNMKQMFLGATSFNQDISGWKVDSVTTMEAMFFSAVSFDQDLGNWNVTNVTKFSTAEGSGENENIIGFLENSGLSSANYDSLLKGWSQQQLQVSENIILDVGNTEYSLISETYKQTITSNFKWTIIDGGLNIDPFITSWETTSANESVTIPTGGGANTPDFDFLIIWGDGTIENHTGDDPDPTHTYAEAGTYTIQIAGVFPHFRPDSEGDLDQLVSIDQWGELEWHSMNHSFAWAKNMTLKATDKPDLSNVSSMRAMFKAAAQFNADLSNWNISEVDTLADMFSGASSFDQDIGDWDISGVVSLHDTEGFLNGSGLTRANYDSLLVGWSKQSGLVQNLTLNVGDVLYTNRPFIRDAHAKLAEENGLNWTIIDGGPFGQAPEIVGLPNPQYTEKGKSISLNLFDYISDDMTADQELMITVETEASRSENVSYDQGSGTLAINAPAESDTFYVDISVKDDFDLITNEKLTVISLAPFIITVQSSESIIDKIFSNEVKYGYWLRTSEMLDYNFIIDWDDGQGYQQVILEKDTTALIHYYDEDKIRRIKIAGNFPHLGGLNGINNLYRRVTRVPLGGLGGLVVLAILSQENGKLLTVEQWGDIKWKSMRGSFWYAKDLKINAKDKPNLSKVTDMSSMFAYSRFFEGDLSEWDVSNVTNMQAMFYYNVSFNSPLFWDVSNVTNMSNMFMYTESYNQGLAFWDVSNVTDMRDMFMGAKSFNQNLAPWNISNVQRFESGLSNASKKGKRTESQIGSSQVDTLSGFLVGSGMSTENVSKMFVGWKDKINPEVTSISVGDIELNEEGANAMKAMREANNMTVTWGGQQGVDDEPVFADLPNPLEISTEDTRILKLWDYVSDPATPDDQLQFKFDVISDSVETIAFDNTNGELSITARADADTFFVAIQASNTEGITALDTLEVRTDASFTTSSELMADIPEEFELNQNYPNPFNPTTVIRYGVPQSSKVRLEVFDMLGRKVATLVNGEQQRAGWHQVNFDATRLASGMYLYRIVAGDYVQTRKMLLIK